MTKLRFIKDWGPHRVGEVSITESQTTVHWLVDVYKVAKIDVPTFTAKPVKVVTDATAQKAIYKAPRDKMVRFTSGK